MRSVAKQSVERQVKKRVSFVLSKIEAAHIILYLDNSVCDETLKDEIRIPLERIQNAAIRRQRMRI